MKRVALWLSSAANMVGLLLLAVASMVLFVVFAVAMRPLLILGFLVAVIGGAVLSCFRPSFRGWFERIDEPQIRYNGLRLATDIALYPSHSWARLSSSGAAVGADDLVQSALGPVETVELPSVGSRVKQGQRLFSLRRGGRRVDVRSPVSGTVVGRNESLLASPELVNEQPFTGGWAVRLQPDHPREESRRLIQGREARGWFRREIDRLLSTVLSEDARARSLPDGGEFTGDLHEQIDDNVWKTLTETVFAVGPRG